MFFISMDLLRPYCGIEKGNQYALAVICMLTNYVFMIPIRSKRNEEVIKAYLTDVYSTFGSSKCIHWVPWEVSLLVNSSHGYPMN